MSIPVLRTAAIRRIEARHQPKAQPPLMERAGSAAAAYAQEIIGRESQRILVAAGPGNNGGDAFVVARLLKQAGHNVTLIFAGDVVRLPIDATAAHHNWLAAGGKVLTEFPKENHFALVIDGLLGIVTLTRPVAGRIAEWIQCINALPCPRLALDLPSGLDASSGRIAGNAVRATHTITFIAMKPGLLTLDGPDHCGTIHLATLHLDPNEEAKGEGEIVEQRHFTSVLARRQQNSHKGSYGNAVIIGGATGMTGAALLAGQAALKLGSGRVYLGMLERLLVDSNQPELMFRTPDSILSVDASAYAIGPGLGQSGLAMEVLSSVLQKEVPVILDADALNLLTIHPELGEQVKYRTAPTLITPHPAEAARLLKTETSKAQADRVTTALTLATSFNALTLLKGAGSIIALPDGRWFINTTGNPGLATAGTGDVLTGMLLAFLAQDFPAAEALLAAVHLHGAAADACVAEGKGPVGLTASEIIEPARRLYNQWINESAS